MRSTTRIKVCAAVGTLALLLTGCTVHHHDHHRTRSAPPGHVRKYETYGHQKPKHVPPGHAKKQTPVVAQRSPAQPVRQVRTTQVHQQVTNVQVTVNDNDGPSAQAPALEPAPLVQTTEYETRGNTKQHVPPGQVRKEETYGHQKQKQIPPGQAKKEEKYAAREQQEERREYEAKQERKQEYVQEQKHESKQERKQEQQTSRGQDKKDVAEKKESDQDSARGNGKKHGKK